MTFRLVLAEDNAALRRLTAAALREHGQYDIVGQCDNGLQVCDLVDESLPDVIVMDLHMPIMNGLQATRHVLVRWPTARVLLWSASNAAPQIKQARLAGAAGYHVKGAGLAALTIAINAVANGGSSWPSIGDSR